MLKKLLLSILSVLCILNAQSQLSYFLSNKFWRLKHAVIDGREYNFNESNSNAPTLQFSGGNIRGNGGCNAYHTRFTINGTNLEINQVMSTRMSCNDMYLSESDYFKALSSSHTLSYEEGSSEFRLVNVNNDELVFFAQFARSGGAYTPPPSRNVYSDDQNEQRVSHRRGKHRHQRGETSLSKKELARQRLLEKKLKGKSGKLTKKEKRELMALQSKEKKRKHQGNTSKSKKGKKSKAESRKNKKATKATKKDKRKTKTSSKTKKKKK